MLFRIWEKKFGRNAHHKKKEEETRALARPIHGHTSQISGSKTSKTQLRQGSSATKGSLRQSKDKSFSQVHNPDTRSIVVTPAGTLHPSWEAKRRLKEKQSIGIVASQGKKIKFSQSCGFIKLVFEMGRKRIALAAQAEIETLIQYKTKFLSYTHDAYPQPTGRISSTTFLHICHSEENRRQSSYKWSNTFFARKISTLFQVVQELVGDPSRIVCDKISSKTMKSKREDKQGKVVESE